MSTSEYLLSALPFQLPFLALYVVGILLAIVGLRSKPKPATLALVGCSLLALSTVATTMLRAHAIGLDTNAMVSWNLATEIGGTVVSLFATALLIAGVFVGRREAPAPEVARGFQGAHIAVPAPHRAVLVLVLGIVSLLVFPPLGVAAWVMGDNDIRGMRAGQMDRSGESITTVGQALGVVGTIFFIVGVIGLIFWAVVALSSI